MFDWVIIGGGIHGCTVANFLLKNGKTTREKLLIIDPHPEPMYEWRRNTEKIGMEFLRSPSVHHIDVDPMSLHNYSSQLKEERGFYGQYDRPSLDLFNEHCSKVIESQEILESWHTGTVGQVTKLENIWLIQTEAGREILSRNIVIAVSINRQLSIPDWAEQFYREKKNIYHVFEERLGKLEDIKLPAVVIGGGITAAHSAIKLAGLFPGEVTLVKRHPFRVHSFDSDPGWLGPKKLSCYSKIEDYDKRRALIQNARNKGSIPRELFCNIKRLTKNNKLAVRDGEAVLAEEKADKIVLRFKTGDAIKAGTVILATGFNPSLPDRGWLRQLINEQQLKCANCGYPIVKKSLEWCDHLYVSGPLAELEIGPVSRNIAGARKAAERIAASII